MQEQLDVAQRFQPRAEAGLRPTDALRDRPDATSVECVEMEHAVRFAEPEGAQNDSLRLVGQPGQNQVPRPPTLVFSIGALQRGHGSPPRPYTLNSCCIPPAAPSGVR